MDTKYIDVRRSLLASAYRITPDDIRIGTDPSDHVELISDLAQWQCTVKNQTFVGTYLHEQILRHQAMYPHVIFIFAKREEVCQTIWDTLSV